MPPHRLFPPPCPDKNIRHIIHHYIRNAVLVELSEARGKKVGIFSGGMIQRLLIAGVLINNPEVIILDELIMFQEELKKIFRGSLK